jgi:hypothetical protein
MIGIRVDGNEVTVSVVLVVVSVVLDEEVIVLGTSSSPLFPWSCAVVPTQAGGGGLLPS